MFGKIFFGKSKGFRCALCEKEMEKRGRARPTWLSVHFLSNSELNKTHEPAGEALVQ